MPRWNIDFQTHINMREAELISLIVEVEAFKRSILKVPMLPDARKEIDQMNIIRQVKGTTGIEGNTLSEQQIQTVLAEHGAGRLKTGRSLEEQEVINADAVFRFIQAFVKEYPDAPLTEELICTIHRMMTDECEYTQTIPGRYRQHNVNVATYKPPDFQEVPELMCQFVAFMNEREVVEGLNPLVRAILAHFYLISIHPFGDGNGRTSRAIEAYILYQSGYNVRGFYSLSNYFYRHRQEYIEQLDAARFQHQGDLTAFVKFSLRGFIEELQQMQDEILQHVRRALFYQLMNEDFRNGDMNNRCHMLMQYLTIDNPEGIPADAFKNRTNFAAKSIYKDMGTRTQSRDLKYLQDAHFVVIQNERIMANLDILND